MSNNYPFADLLAERGGRRYFIGVKTRNEERDVGGINGSYNCILVSSPANARLKAHGLSVKEITAMAIAQVRKLALRHDAEPAWIAISVRPCHGTYAAYFGLLDELGVRRSIPMTEAARKHYVRLADWTADSRVTPDLHNRR